MDNKIITSSTRAYIRYREDLPETHSQSHALHGFRELGAETVPFYCLDDIDRMGDLGPETLVVGYIGDIHRALRNLNKPIPQALDYPKPLNGFLERGLFLSTIGKIRRDPTRWFIKPVEHKLFTGFIWEGHHDVASRRRIVTLDDDVQIWMSQVIKIISEFRCFILDGEIIDVRRYNGDWSVAPSQLSIENAVIAIENSNDKRRSYCLDFAVTDSEHTVLIEMNDGFAFGSYGLDHRLYAQCLAARWKELMT